MMGESPINYTERSPEQKEREGILFDLYAATQNGAGFPAKNLSAVLWIHFTDYCNFYDLPRLLDQGIIERASYKYTKQGDWRDQFPPTAYQLTDKGIFILKNPSRWVFDGDTADKK
jgi:hypothetical protein